MRAETDCKHSPLILTGQRITRGPAAWCEDQSSLIRPPSRSLT